MAFELWVSEETGYRRRGTRLIELHHALGQTIRTNYLFEPILSCPADAPADEMSGELLRRDFDVAGVKLQKDSPVFGYVSRASLVGGTVKDHLQNFEPNELVDSSTSLQDVLKRLKDQAFLFVQVDGKVEGILTRADLNKPIVRTFLFGIVSLLEMHMAFWVKTEYGDGRWISELSTTRLNKARAVNESRPELDLFDCVQFADRRDLFTKSFRIRAMLSLGSRKSATAWLKRAENLRNDLAHSQYYLDGGGSWTVVIELVEWLDRLITTSDGLVEERAEAAAEGYVSKLW